MKHKDAWVIQDTFLNIGSQYDRWHTKKINVKRVCYSCKAHGTSNGNIRVSMGEGERQQPVESITAVGIPDVSRSVMESANTAAPHLPKLRYLTQLVPIQQILLRPKAHTALWIQLTCSCWGEGVWRGGFPKTKRSRRRETEGLELSPSGLSSAGLVTALKADEVVDNGDSRACLPPHSVNLASGVRLLSFE